MYHIRINENQIVWETEKAYLIKYPKSKVWKFWISKKLVQRNMNSYIMLILDGMKIKLISDAGNEKEIFEEQILEDFGFDMDFDILEDLKD